MRKILTGAIALTASLIPAVADGDDWTRGYEPCAVEDSPGPCYWDAEMRGTGDGAGKGRSFVVDADDVVTYVGG